MQWYLGRRLGQLAAAGAIVVSAGCAGSAGPAPTGRTPGLGPPAGPGQHPIPGTDAGIQRWFLDSTAVKVRFNDALLQAERAVAARTAAGCRPLAREAQAMTATLPTLQKLSPAALQLATAIRPPLATFAAAAGSCLAGDFAAAHTALDAGVAQQADAQQTVDEILDGDL